MRSIVLASVLATAILASAVEAQESVGAGRGAMRMERRARQLASGMGAQPARSQQLQQQIRRSLWRVTKQRLGFSNEQMLRLEHATQRYDVQRRALAQQEKAQRVALRTEMLADTAANQGIIAAALDQLHAVQVRRLELQGEEQKELAAFMTPLQRARFTTLQEQVRRRLQELARARADSSAAPAPNAPL